MAKNRRFEEKAPKIGVRHVQVLLLFLCFVVNFMGRLNAAVSVVAITNANTTNPDFPEYKWNEKEKSYILSSFYWGYNLTQFLASYLCPRFGSKVTLLISSLGSALLSLVTPVSIAWKGWKIYCFIRMFQGLFQGMMIPAIHHHLAKWAPIEERTRLGALSLTGMEMGALLAMAVPGYIAHSSWGWPGISYFSGAIGLFWCTIWMIFASSSPIVSKIISSEEKAFILSSQQKTDGVQNKIPIPFKAICTSVPFISLVIVRLAESWGLSTLQMQIPTYLHSVLKMDIKSNSLFSALPYVMMFIMAYVYLISADIILRKKIVSLTVLRKTINSIAMWISSGTLIALGFMDESQKLLAIILVTVTIGVNGGVSIGSGLNAIDLSSNHAAFLMGIVNTVVSQTFMMAPLFVGIVVDDETDRRQWQIVFLISALVFFFGNLQYVIFGTTTTQHWNDEKYMIIDVLENKNTIQDSNSRLNT